MVPGTFSAPGSDIVRLESLCDMPSKRSKPKLEITYELACDRVAAALEGDTRAKIVSTVTSSDFDATLSRLRDCMRAHLFAAGDNQVALGRVVNQLDKRTRQDGFHALHDWHGPDSKMNEDSIPVDVLTYMIGKGTPPADQQTVLAILLDYYFIYLLALLAMRAWDEGDPDTNYDRVSALVERLQGTNGSGQQFVENAETLVLLATSHYESDDMAYVRLAERVRGLNLTHRENFARAHASVMASHLRFGFEVTYARDMVGLRNDNDPDYPLLCFALLTLVSAYDRMVHAGSTGLERERVVEGILNGLTPDARAFVGTPPRSLADYRAECAEIRALVLEHRERLLKEFEAHGPTKEHYSPIAFYFNFLHNVLKAVVVDALLRGKPWELGLNDLLTGLPRDKALSQQKESLAQTLVGYARAHPDRIGGRFMPVILYEPRKGYRAVEEAIKHLNAQAQSKADSSAAPGHAPKEPNHRSEKDE